MEEFNLSPQAKKVIAILLDSCPIGKIHLFVGPGWLDVVDELEALQKRFENDVLTSGLPYQKIDKDKAPVTTDIFE